MSRSSLQQVVASLPNSSEEIRAMIASDGCKGRMRTVSRCPLAIFLTKRYGGHYSVGKEFMVRSAHGDHEIIPTPRAVASFVEAFDGGSFPELQDRKLGQIKPKGPISRNVNRRRYKGRKVTDKRWKKLVAR